MRKLYLLVLPLLFFIFAGVGHAQPNQTNIDQTRPGEYRLFQNYPNPFNPTTEIKYSLPENSFVSLKVYNSLGNEVADLVNENESAGSYKVTFDGKDLSSGIYYFQLKANNFIKVKKMILLK